MHDGRVYQGRGRRGGALNRGAGADTVNDASTYTSSNIIAGTGAVGVPRGF